MIEFSEYAYKPKDFGKRKNPVVYIDTWGLLTDGHIDFLRCKLERSQKESRICSNYFTL